MKILMIAPEPIFEPRGTPLSIVGRLKALSDIGYRVDLLTYSIGEDVNLPGINIIRIPRIPGIRKVKIGPSLKKIPLDLCLMLKSLVWLLKDRYDLIHSHEEAGFWGTALSRIFRIPHLYDMHSSLPQQLKNFQFSDSRILKKIFQKLEEWVIQYSSSVITICPDLYDHVNKLFSNDKLVLIENAVDYEMIFGKENNFAEIYKTFNFNGKTIALYTGTFEPYQGLDLLIGCAKRVVSQLPSIIFLLVGGSADQMDYYYKKVRKLGLEKHFILTGQVSPQDVNSYIRCANVLLSPRVSGTNTPLKIYSYLRSGVPIVATRLHTHTQVLNDEIAVLTEPNPEGFSQGILSVVNNSVLAKSITRKSMKMTEEKYSYSVYLRKLQQAIQKAIA